MKTTFHTLVIKISHIYLLGRKVVELPPVRKGLAQAMFKVASAWLLDRVAAISGNGIANGDQVGWRYVALHVVGRRYDITSPRRLYLEFEDTNAVIHAHPKMATIFACREKPMEPFLDAMKKYGQIPVLPRHLEVDGPEFGQAIVDIFRDCQQSFQKHGHAVFYPYHGILVAAPTLEDAYDLLERIEFNATAILFSRLLEDKQ